MIYRLLYKLLHDSANVRDRVGTRIFAENAPANTQGPCIILRNVSGSPVNALDNESGLADVLMQVDYYDETRNKAESGYQLIRNRLSGYGPGSVDVLSELGAETAIYVSAINIVRTAAYVEEPRDASDKWTHRVTADFQVFHSQDVPTHA